MLAALTRRFALADDVNLDEIAERLPLTLSGAELYALCAAALTRAIHDAAGRERAERQAADEAKRANGRPTGRCGSDDATTSDDDDMNDAPHGLTGDGPPPELIVCARHFVESVTELGYADASLIA